MNQEKSVDILLPVPFRLQEQRQLKAMLGYKEPPSLGWQKIRSSQFTWEILKHLALHLGFLGHLPLSPNLTWKSSTGAISTSYWLVVARWIWMRWMCAVSLWRHDNRGEKTQHPIWVWSLPDREFCCKCPENIYTMKHEKKAPESKKSLRRRQQH